MKNKVQISFYEKLTRDLTRYLLVFMEVLSFVIVIIERKTLVFIIQSMDIFFLMALMKNLNIQPPDMLMYLFVQFDISNLYNGPYFFNEWSDNDEGEWKNWRSPTGYQRNKVSPLFAENINPLFMVFLNATLAIFGVEILLRAAKRMKLKPKKGSFK